MLNKRDFDKAAAYIKQLQNDGKTEEAREYYGLIVTINDNPRFDAYMFCDKCGLLKDT